MPLTWFSHSTWNIGIFVEHPLRAMPPSEINSETLSACLYSLEKCWSISYLCYIGQNRSCIPAFFGTIEIWVPPSRNNTSYPPRSCVSDYLNTTGAGIVFINGRFGFLMKGIQCLIEG